MAALLSPTPASSSSLDRRARYRTRRSPETAVRWVAAGASPRLVSPDCRPGMERTLDLGLGGKRAVVTGGSRGIGRAIVLGLAQSGASVAACFNRESGDVKRLRGELGE